MAGASRGVPKVQHFNRSMISGSFMTHLVSNSTDTNSTERELSVNYFQNQAAISEISAQASDIPSDLSHGFQTMRITPLGKRDSGSCTDYLAPSEGP